MYFKNIIQKFKDSFSVDLRALGCMRIGISIILLIDLFVRSLSIKAFYTDEGVLPLSILKLYNWNDYYFSFHALSGDLWWQITLFIINVICVVLLLIGYRTRLFTFICWLLLVSLQNRNPFILQGGDDLLRITLLWGIFLPWGERYSIKKNSSYPNKYFSIATIGFIALVCSVYFFSALLKTSSEWRTEGTAIYYALCLDQIRLPFGTFIHQFPTLLKILTFLVFYIELISPLLIFIPFLPKKIKFFGVITIILLHFGISVSLYVGLFFIIGLVTLLGLFPDFAMDWIESKFIKPKQILPIAPIEPQPSIILDVFSAIKNMFLLSIFSYCLMLNLSTVKSFPYTLNLDVIKFGSILRLEQTWGMFSPFILKDDGFYLYSGYTDNKKQIDIKHNGADFTFTKPQSMIKEFESDRWRKYTENYAFNNNNYMRPYYCKYLLKKWNAENPNNKISELTIFFMKEVSLPDYKTKPLEKNVVCNCNILE